MGSRQNEPAMPLAKTRVEPLMAVRMAAAALALLLGLPSRAAAQDGGAVFRASCASCHGSPDGAAPANAPDLATLRQASPEAILNTLLNGKMRIQAAPLSDADRRAVAEFLGGRPIRETPADASLVPCKSSPPFRGDAAG